MSSVGLLLRPPLALKVVLLDGTVALLRRRFAHHFVNAHGPCVMLLRLALAGVELDAIAIEPGVEHAAAVI